MTLESSKLRMSRGCVVSREGDALTCVATGGVVRWRTVIEGARDHVIAGDRVMVLAAAQLATVDLATGRLRGQVSIDARSLHAGGIPEVVTCNGAMPALAILGAGIELAPLPVSELALACDRTRVLGVREGHLTLRRGSVVLWTARAGDRDERAATGAILLEGRVAAICLVRRSDSRARIVVVELRDGSVLHAVTIEHARQIEFAPRRGRALVRIGETRLATIDLRVGRIVGCREEPSPITDLAVDAGFEQVVLELDGGLVVATGDAIATPSTADCTEIAAEPTPAEPLPAEPVAAPTVEAPVIPEPAMAGSPGVLRALGECVEAEVASAEEAAVDLQARLYRVGALLDRAIAAAWDCGRIATHAGALPFEREVAGVLFQTRGRAPAQLARAERHVAHYERVRVDVAAHRADRATPIDRLARELGLSPLAVDIMVAVAAPQLWGELARLYGVLANDPMRPVCDELLLCQLLEPVAARGSLVRELDFDQPLRRSGVVTITGSRPFGAIRVDPLVLALMRGIDPREAAGMERPITPRTATRTLAELRLAPGVIERLVTELAEPGTGPARVVLCGRIGSGRRSLAAALAVTCGKTIGCIDAFADGEPAARAEQLREQLARCRMLGWIPCVDGLDDIAVVDHPARRSITDALAAHAGPMILRLPLDAAVPLPPGYVRADLAALSEGARAGAWAASLAAHGLPADGAGELAARFRVGPGIAERAIAAAAGMVASGTATAAIELAVRQHLEDRLGTIASRVTRLPAWPDLIVPEDILDSLLELVARVRRRRQVYETWGYDRRITTARGVTALFQGGPGTGKTLAAGVIARELGLDLYRVDVARVMSKWIGETEKNLGAVFDAAEDGRAVLLFDEADSLFSKRTEVKSSNDRYANVEVNYLLQRLDSFEGIAILTTNLTSSIDPAFKRRLGMRLTFPFPDEDTREQIWRAHVSPEVPRAGELALGELAQRFRLSGGYIRNAALRAAFLAAEEGVALSQQHLERAVRLEFRELGKLSESGTLE